VASRGLARQEHAQLGRIRLAQPNGHQPSITGHARSGRGRYRVIQLSYGLESPFILESALETCNQCNALGMPFALCMDPWSVKDVTGNLLESGAKEMAMVAALLSQDMQFMIGSGTYLPGKPVLDFSTTVNPAAILAAVPGITWLVDGPDFDWPRFPQIQNKTTLPCKYLKFDDGTRVIDTGSRMRIEMDHI
jgi:hypothetical protein